MSVTTSLHTLFFEVTRRCNALCDHCGSRCDSKFEKELPAEIFNKVLDEIATKMDPQSIMLNITGGEPLIRKDIFAITKHANALGFDWGLVTNGMLITDEVINKMKKTHMSTITISIDGMKETHESFRHVPGCFDTIIQSIQKLKDANFIEHLQVTFIATKNNITELPNLYRLLSMIGIDSLRISNIDPIGRANDNQHLMLEEKDFHFLFDFMKIHQNDALPVVWSCSHYFGNTNLVSDATNRKFSCLSGIQTASVLSNGDIFGCPNIPRRKELIQGNVQIDSFVDVWNTKFKYYRNKEIRKVNACKNCDKWQYCQGDSLHTYDFSNNVPLFCYKKYFSSSLIATQKEDSISANQLIAKLANRYGKMNLLSIRSVKPTDITVILTPTATADLYQYFHYGTTHPLNMYEQQVALIGIPLGNLYLIPYIVPSILLNRASNMATTNNFCLEQVLDEVDIIKENVAKSDSIFQTEWDHHIRLLGFAHSHPMNTEFRFSSHDTKNQQAYVKEFGTFFSILINPQKRQMVCFEGKDCTQANLLLLSK